MPHIGQILYDNDPRYSGRTVEIIRIEQRYLVCKCGPREVIIRHDRVHSDAEQRRSGYSLVPPRAIAGRPSRDDARVLEAEPRASTGRPKQGCNPRTNQQAEGKNENSDNNLLRSPGRRLFVPPTRRSIYSPPA
jgi:hypothetical protein